MAGAGAALAGQAQRRDSLRCAAHKLRRTGCRGWFPRRQMDPGQLGSVDRRADPGAHSRRRQDLGATRTALPPHRRQWLAGPDRQPAHPPRGLRLPGLPGGLLRVSAQGPAASRPVRSGAEPGSQCTRHLDRGLAGARPQTDGRARKPCVCRVRWRKRHGAGGASRHLAAMGIARRRPAGYRSTALDAGSQGRRSAGQPHPAHARLRGALAHLPDQLCAGARRRRQSGRRTGQRGRHHRDRGEQHRARKAKNAADAANQAKSDFWPT